MKPIPLTPTSGGGMCIADSALQPADIIVSAGIGAVSTAIRYGTASDVSHAALYIGDGEVIEAIGPGVKERPLNKSLDDHSLAVAYRARGMTPSAAAIIVHFAKQWKGKKYDTVGAAAAGARNPFVCVVVMGIAPCAAARAGKFKSSDKFYCSQLVLEAYRRAGVSFITQDPNTSQPEDMVTAYSKDKLLYVGHLVSTKAERKASSA
jgi:cell wall-associated NlpC family hydrolase